jgi:hypothetical protein
MLKVRCSAGLRPSLYYGSCSNRNGMDVDLPLIDSDKSIMVNLVRAALCVPPAVTVFSPPSPPCPILPVTTCVGSNAAAVAFPAHPPLTGAVRCRASTT